jgi:hypothetical protein
MWRMYEFTWVFAPNTESPTPKASNLNPYGDAGIGPSLAAFHDPMLLSLLSIVDTAALEAVFKMAAEPAKPHS